MATCERRRLAVRTVLATFSAGCSCVAVASWLARFDWGWSGLQEVQWWINRHGLAGQGHCWLCGMSRAFRSIWRGDIHQAVIYNAHSVTLFTFVLIGCILPIIVLFAYQRGGHR